MIVGERQDVSISQHRDIDSLQQELTHAGRRPVAAKPSARSNTIAGSGIMKMRKASGNAHQAEMVPTPDVDDRSGDDADEREPRDEQFRAE